VQLDMIEEVFNLFDTDGQQQLDEEELASAIFALGFSQNGHLEVLANFIFIASLPHGNHIPIFHSIITKKNHSSLLQNQRISAMISVTFINSIRS
jgi:hypothetical protein